jgi:DNA mismatch repair protein MSH3
LRQASRFLRSQKTYELTFAVESFGIECGRLAGLPESLLTVASKRSSALQRDVQQRTRQKKYVSLVLHLLIFFHLVHRIIRIVELINRCLSVGRNVSSEAMDELQRMRQSIMDPNPN